MIRKLKVLIMKDVIQRLQNLKPELSKIIQVSGAAGASIGVLHHGEIIHTAGLGFRDVEQQFPPDENTVYHLASLSKSFTAAAIGILIENENFFDWNTPVSKILPDFHHHIPSIQDEVTVLDFLSHRTGLAGPNAYWDQDRAEMILQLRDLYSIVSSLEEVHPLRAKWLYNNWGYNVAAEIIEKSSKMTWGDYLAEKLFTPLGLTDTTTESQLSSENFAKGYSVLSDGSPCLVASPTVANGVIMQGAAGVKGNVKDLLQYCKAFLHAAKDQRARNSTTTPGSPFKNLQTLLTGHIPLDSDTRYEQSYGAGWVIAQLPSPLGIGTNPIFMDEMPVVGKGSKKEEVWYHNGNLQGFFSTIHMIPETDTAIVVLVNSIAKNDTADWISQCLIEAILDNLEKNDYVELATKSAATYKKLWMKLGSGLNESRSSTNTHRPLKDFTGKYYNKVHNWVIEVIEVIEITEADATEPQQTLYFSFQGLPTQRHRLERHGSLSFSWLLTEDESNRLGRWPEFDPLYYIFHFEAGEKNCIRSLRWVHDPDVRSGEVFMRE